MSRSELMERMMTKMASLSAPSTKRLVAHLGVASAPGHVPACPASWALPNECFDATERQVEELGGRLRVGWRLMEWPKVLIEAEFHSVWESPEGKLIDVSHYEGDETGCVFVLDDGRPYREGRVDNVRLALSDDALVLEFIDGQRRAFEVVEAYTESDGFTRMPVDAARSLQVLQLRMEEVRTQLRMRSTGRNEPCWCGSGRKQKKCPH